MSSLGIGLTLWARYPYEVDWLLENSEDKDIVEKEIKSIHSDKLSNYIDDIRASIEDDSREFLKAIADPITKKLSKNGAIAKPIRNNNPYSVKWNLIQKNLPVTKKMQAGINIYNDQGILVVNVWLWSSGGRSIERSIFEIIQQSIGPLRNLKLGQDFSQKDWEGGSIRLDRIEIKLEDEELDAKSDIFIQQAQQTLLLFSDKLISKLLK